MDTKEVTLSSLAEGVDYHSYSSVHTFTDVCPLQYRFRYVERRPRESVAAAVVFGSAMNAALVAIDEDLVKGRPPELGRAAEILRARLEEAYSEGEVPVVSTRGETLEGLYEKGRGLLGCYLEGLSAEEAPVELPRRFTVPLLEAGGKALPRPLLGELDRWVRTSDGRLGIGDWKTASSRWTADRLRKDDQATAYLWAGEWILGRRPDFFRYEVLLKTSRPAVERHEVERTERDRRRFLKKVVEVDKALKSGVFVPNDQSFACTTCPFRRACETWQDDD